MVAYKQDAVDALVVAAADILTVRAAVYVMLQVCVAKKGCAEDVPAQLYAS